MTNLTSIGVTAAAVTVMTVTPPSEVVPPNLLADFTANHTNVSLRAGVLHAAPFAIIEEGPEGEYIYSGLQPDLLNRLQQFAKEDGVSLNFQLRPSPPRWDDALDMVAYDCPQVLEAYYASGGEPQDQGDDKYVGRTCEDFDLIVADLTTTPQRFRRVDFTPPFLQSATGAMKYVGLLHVDDDGGDDTTHSSTTSSSSATEIETLRQADRMGATICGQSGSMTMRVVQEKFPNAEYYLCTSQDDCYNALQQGKCSLLTRDKLALKGKAYNDPRFEVTAEEFNIYYLGWPLRNTLSPTVSYLLKRWIHRAVRNGTMDELYHQYFEKELCPIGLAGVDCNLPCHPKHGSADVHGRCICKSVKWSGDDCSMEMEENLNRIPSSLKIIAYCLFATNVLVILGCGLWLLRNWVTIEVQTSQPSFLLLVLLGCLISSSTIIAMGQEDTSENNPDAACLAIPWLYSVGFCVTFGTLFAKIRRVYIIFKSSAEMRRVKVTLWENLAVIGSALLIDVIILIVWTLLDPLHWERVVIAADQFGDPLESEGYCTSEHWVPFASTIAGLHLFLLTVASWMCFVSRHVPTSLSEGKYVSIALISNLQIFLVGIPVLIVVGSEPATSFFVRSVVIWMNDLVVVLLIFGNLIYTVTFRREEASFQAQIRSSMQDYSKRSVNQVTDLTTEERDVYRCGCQLENPVSNETAQRRQ